jgi:imidazolonepropionase-like amidohydrolase
LLRYGFTQVLDTGSYLLETLQLKRAILDQTLRGPEIFTANGSFVYRDGTPAYLPPDLKLPEAVTPAIGASLTQQFLAQGADGIKIFSGSFQTPTHTIYLPVDVIKAITDTAHSMDSFVVSHPTTVQGLNNAVEGGVDVIAHTTSSGHEIADHILRQMQDNDIALIPTLSLWRYEMMKHTGNKNIADAVEADAISQMKQLLTANVEILFGTDVGYMTQYDTTREYQLMQRAGMSWPLIHHALTVGPAARFSEGRAVLEEGGKANIVLFEGDPAKDITALSRVAYTIIDGKIVYRRAE